jgi:superkiller protein 3
LYVAIAQLSQGSNVSEGIARLSAAIAKYQPAGAEYYLQLADALSGAGRYREALPVYEQALRREPESVPAHERLALLLISLGQIARAEEALKWALQRAADAPAWAEFGLIEQAQGKISGATAALEKAIQLDPDMVEAYNSLGTIRMQSGDTARAETALRDAIRVQPNNAASRNNLANLLASTDRLEEALLQYQAALRYGDNYSGARYNYALTLVRMQRLDEAKAQLVALLRADPHDSDAHELLGDVLVREGHTTAAIEHYREVAQNGTGAVRARARTMLRKLSSPH